VVGRPGLPAGVGAEGRRDQFTCEGVPTWAETETRRRLVSSSATRATAPVVRMDTARVASNDYCRGHKRRRRLPAGPSTEGEEKQQVRRVRESGGEGGSGLGPSAASHRERLPDRAEGYKAKNVPCSPQHGPEGTSPAPPRRNPDPQPQPPAGAERDKTSPQVRAHKSRATTSS
jgi:hypothetical protein